MDMSTFKIPIQRLSSRFCTTIFYSLAVLLLQSCDSSDPTSSPMDSRMILEAHISHGIGYSPFDSPLVQDSIAAEMIVSARECLPVSQLISIHSDSTEGSQLLLQLQSDGLVDIHEDRACTTFPLLLNDAKDRYTTITSDVAEDAMRELTEDLYAITELVQDRGWNEWQYHFVWSQLFDSQFAWTEMMQRGLVPPLGELVAWVIYPDHPLRSGTNYFPDTELRDYWLMVTWRPGSANTVALVGSTWDVIYKAALEDDTLTTAERTKLAELDLLDDMGQLNVPVIKHGDPLLDLLQSVAKRYISFLERRIPLENLVVITKADKQHTFAMAYHDISWGVLDRLIRLGKLSIPSALEHNAPATHRSMQGVTALTPVHTPFIELIFEAIESQ